MKLRIFIALCFAFLGLASESCGEDIEIELSANSVRDPLLIYRFPDDASRDSMQFGANGLLIDQKAAKEPREPDVVGLKLTTSTRGDFSFKLDLECLQLTQPGSGWGHGLVVKFVFADENKPLISLGCIATPRFQKAYRVTVETSSEKPMFKTEACEFKKGIWSVTRNGTELVFVIEEPGSNTEIHRLAYTSAELLEVQIWANRLPKDNGAAKFLLKRLSLTGDEFFARSEVTRSRFGIWTPFLIASATMVFLLFVYVLKRRQ